MTLESELVNKILDEERKRDKLYPEPSILNEIEKIKDCVLEKKAEKILGTILDKNELAKKFIELMPVYYDEAQNWWIWNSIDYCWKIVDETDILLFIQGSSDSNVINSKERTEILNAIKLRARATKPKEIKKTMIQFSKEIVDIETGDRFPISPEYFVTNPIPFRLGKSTDTSKFDKLFAEWVAPEDVKCLYEIPAYCMLPDYPIERIFVLLGGGSNGKSTYLKIIYTLLGFRNICSSSLEALTRSRFETCRLYKKLACLMGETNLNTLENSQIIKRLCSGKDPIPVEFKNKGHLEIINYAKLIIATNNLPPTEDKTDGFYRKWRIIEFPNQFEKEVNVLKDLTTEDYENLCAKCLEILDEILKNRNFTGDGTIKDRQKKYEEKSNPFDKFWLEYVDDSDPNANIGVWEFEQEINKYMKEHRVRAVSDRTICAFMRDKRIEQGKKRVEWYDNEEAKVKQVRTWLGIKWKT